MSAVGIAMDTAALPVFDRFGIWGTSVVLGVTHPSDLGAARAILDWELSATEQAASRFREGTEIFALNAAAGQGPLPVSSTMLDLVICALDAAEMTDGACDPTVADSLLALGYDRDFDSVIDSGPLGDDAVRHAPGVDGIVVDRSASSVELPAGVHLDLGATAKARTADRAAVAIATRLGCGALVDIGGDLRVAGPAPDDGWHIGVADEARSGDRDQVQEVIAIRSGGVASSSSAVRSWKRGGRSMHHVIDPASGYPAAGPWRLVTVVANSCVDANAFSTAGIVWGDDALFELPQRSLTARLVAHDGSVEHVGGWPRPINQRGAE